MNKIYETNKYLGVLLSFALLVFITKIVASLHGYPYILNIDEPALVRSSLGLRFNFWITHFDWPHLNFYLNYVFYECFIKFRFILQYLNLRGYIEPWAPLFWNDPFIFYYLSRVLNSFFVSLSVIPLYFFVTKLLADRNNSYVVAFFSGMSLLLFDVVLTNSLLAIQESALLFFSSLILYLSLKINDDSRVKNFVIFGFVVGLAASIKYNAGLLGFTVAVAFLNSQKPERIKVISKIVLAVLVSVIVFCLANISILKYWEIFWSEIPGKGFLWQLKSNSSPLQGLDYFENILKQLKNLLVDNVPMSFFMILGLAIYIRDSFRDLRVSVSKLFYLCLTIILFLFISRYGRAGAHYFIPLYPIFAIFVGYSGRFFIRERRNVFTWILLCMILFVVKIYPYFTNSNIVEAVEYANKLTFDYQVYVAGDDLESVNIINNLGFKKAKNDSKIEPQGILLTEREFDNKPEFKLLKIIDNAHSISKKVYIYSYIPR
jgi:hypothetical protein